MAYNSLMVFTGNANPKLAADVAQELYVDLGRAKVGRFSDGEVSVELQEHVRGRDIFVLQSTCDPCNDNLMELLVIVDALKRASAGRITAAIPYFGYARQDRRSSGRTPSERSWGSSRRLRLISAKPGKPARPITWSQRRPASASPAVGYSHLHQEQQKALLDQAFGKLKGFVLTK